MAITIEQLLAMLAIDSAEVTVVAERYVLLQRDPQPDETNISIDTDVSFWLVDLDSDPLAAPYNPTFTVTVAGVAAGTYTGGVFTPTAPWSGTVTPTTPTDPFVGWHIVLQQPFTPIFSSEEIVEVNVALTVAGGFGYGSFMHFPFGYPPVPGNFAFDYSFQIQDLTPPRLVSADTLDLFTVRVTFDDEMAVVGVGSILDAQKWGFETLNEDPYPAVDLTVIEVYEVEDSGGTEFDLVLSWEMTQGCLYRVTVASTAEDSSANSMDAVYVSVTFTGFQLPAVPGRSFSHWASMVPEKNKQEDESRDLERFSLIIQEMLDFMLNDIDRFSDAFDPDLCSDAIINSMLSQMGNPFGEWTELELEPIQRRKLLSILVDIYRSKGTDAGIEQAVLFLLGKTVHVVEYLANGWILGVDALGSNGIAEIQSLAGETYDLTLAPAPWELTFEVDVGVEQVVTLVVGDFANPAAALVSELATVFEAQLQGATFLECKPGQPAWLVSTAGPFALSGGDTLELEINGDTRLIIFEDEDFEVAGVATDDEVARRIVIECPELVVRDHPYSAYNNMVVLYTKHQGDDATLTVTGGTGASVLLFGAQAGGDESSFLLYSNKEAWSASVEGGQASIICTNPESLLATVLGVSWNPSGSAGGAILAPSNEYAVYAFDIEYDGTLTDEEKILVRQIAEYMKVAHTHLVNIRPALELQWPEGWILGIHELDLSAELMP